MSEDAKFDPNDHFSDSDVAVDNPASPMIVSLRSKTNLIQERVDVKVILGQTGDDLCSVSALLDYLQL